MSLLVFEGDGVWNDWFLPVFLIASILTQIFGFIGESLTASRCPWGMRAVVGFWISVLAWVPLGSILALLAGLFR